MTTDVEIERSLAAVAATLNDQQLEAFEKRRVQEIVTPRLRSASCWSLMTKLKVRG